jgi:hypothetical protein
LIEDSARDKRVATTNEVFWRDKLLVYFDGAMMDNCATTPLSASEITYDCYG